MKCSPAGWCKALDERLSDSPNHRGKGLTTAEGLLGDEEESRVIGVMYKKNAKDRGLMLNWCPFCGAAIDFGFRDRLDVEGA